MALAHDSTLAKSSDLEEQIAKACQQYVAQRSQEAIDEVKRKLDQELPQIIASVSVAVASYLEPYNNEAVIQIRLKR